MTFKQWYLGIATAAAAFIPLAAYADPIPNLTGGTSGPVEIKFSGVTVETSDAGSLCSGGTCKETTWGAGTLTTVNPQGDAGTILWSSGTAGQQVGFVLYGIADKTVTAGGLGALIGNTGANASVFGDTNGKINIDLYTFTSPDKTPCFGCADSATKNLITPGDRSANTAVTGVANVAGITDVGELLMHIELIAGVDPLDSDVTLAQNVTAATFPASGTGSFFANCISGPGCAMFTPGLIDTVFAYFHGLFNLENASGGEADAGWDGEIHDPLKAIAAIPEPASIALLGSALVFLGVMARRRRNGMPV